MNNQNDIVRSIEHLVDAKTKAEAALQIAWETTPADVYAIYAYAYGLLRSSIELEVPRLRAALGRMIAAAGASNG